MDDTLETLEESPPPLHYISVILPGDMGKQSQLLLQPTEVELGLQVGVGEFDKIQILFFIWVPKNLVQKTLVKKVKVQKIFETN